ncbi:MAG: SufE family protein [Flammeovirgaceae bacterium]
MTISEVQQEIIEEFEVLAGDRESTIFYIMELGQKLPPLDSKHQIDENLIKGCQSKVWLVSEFRDGKVYFHADSNTEITKGLISLLIRILSGRTPEEIVQAELFFLQKIGMSGIIGSQRSNGLASMIKQMKLYAIAYQQVIQK